MLEGVRSGFERRMLRICPSVRLLMSSVLSCWELVNSQLLNFARHQGCWPPQHAWGNTGQSHKSPWCHYDEWKHRTIYHCFEIRQPANWTFEIRQPATIRSYPTNQRNDWLSYFFHYWWYSDDRWWLLVADRSPLNPTNEMVDWCY